MSVPTIPGYMCEDGLAQTFRQEIAELLGRNNPKFPGAQPVSFARNHLAELQRTDYYLCEKTDGIRCLLYCTTGDGPDDEIHYLIDRKNNYYYVKGLHFPHHEDPSMARFHKDTLLDGELVLDKMPDGSEKLRYLVFDCLVVDGNRVMHKPLDKRLGAFQVWIYQPYLKCCKAYPDDAALMPFEIREKKMEKAYGLEMMFRDVLPNLPHGNDGVIFTCRETPYQFGTDEHILKWKPPHENTIDFVLRLGDFPTFDPEDDDDGPIEDYDAGPDFKLHVHYGRGDDRDFAPLHVGDDEWEAMKRLGEVLDGRIIECYKDNHDRWRFKKEAGGWPRFRDDKPEANHISTVEKVLQSIDDGVTEQELRQAAKAVANAWKHRHPEEGQSHRRRDP